MRLRQLQVTSPPVQFYTNDLDGEKPWMMDDSPQDSFQTGTGHGFRNIGEELQAELAKAEVALL